MRFTTCRLCNFSKVFYPCFCNFSKVFYPCFCNFSKFLCRKDTNFPLNNRQ